ncbi:hypothetical protein Peur_010042 [Populus x canadensis]
MSNNLYLGSNYNALTSAFSRYYHGVLSLKFFAQMGTQDSRPDGRKNIPTPG